MRTSKWLTIAALALGLATLFACEKKEDGYRSSGSKNRSTERGMSGTSWLNQAAEANLAEIDAGRLAASKSTSADVKQFGLHMVEDHSKANIDLTELAVKKGLTWLTKPYGMDTLAQMVQQVLMDDGRHESTG